MKIKKISIKDFRRFTDLTIEGLGPQVKLVVLLGRNGSGKSSLFDALSLMVSQSKHGNYSWDTAYYSKSNQDLGDTLRKIHCEFHDLPVANSQYEFKKKDFYFRTAYRFDATARIDRLQKLPSILNDEHDPRRMIN